MSVKKKFKVLWVETLCEVMHILGCVKEANELELRISLPSDLQGFVQVTKICNIYSKKLNEQLTQDEPLKDLFHVFKLLSPGMLVRYMVTSVSITEQGKEC